MSQLLKINNNGQILHIALDRPEANALDAPRFDSGAGGQADGARGLQPRRTAPRGGTVSRPTCVQYRGCVLLYDQPDRKHR